MFSGWMPFHANYQFQAVVIDMHPNRHNCQGNRFFYIGVYFILDGLSTTTKDPHQTPPCHKMKECKALVPRMVPSCHNTVHHCQTSNKLLLVLFKIVDQTAILIFVLSYFIKNTLNYSAAKEWHNLFVNIMRSSLNRSMS